MVSELDVWRVANLLLKQYGEKAPVEAAVGAVELDAAGKAEGASTYRRISQAAEEPLRTAPPDGATH